MITKRKIVSIAKSLTEVRVAGQIIAAIVILMISWSGVKAIQKNYELQKQIASLRAEVKAQDLKRQNLAIENKFLETDEYLDLAARENFGKAGKGEKVYVVTDEIAQKYIPNIEKDSAVNNAVKNKSWYQANLDSWRDFFFGG